MAPLLALLQEIRAEFPEFELLPKSQSRLMRLIDVCLRIITLGLMRKFMTEYTTVIGWKVYVPETWPTWDWRTRASILRHERVHMRQLRRHGFLLHAVLYLFVPFPFLFAYYRTRFEKEAYEESLHAEVEYWGKECLTPDRRERMIRRFVREPYFWAWPWRRSIERWYDRAAKKALRDNGYYERTP